MKHALKVGSVAGIGVYVHWTFGVLVVGLFGYYLARGQSLPSALLGIGLILAVFLCVILHEFGHALTALKFGVPTRDITLYPIGGVARLQLIPSEPMKEFWIAIAGPAVNAIIAAVLFLGVIVSGGRFSPMFLVEPGIGFFTTLMWMNLLLAGFNLLPAFPMDGGRILRALLATRLEYARATEIAANVGQIMAILFGLIGLLTFNPVLLFIALFVYVGAQQEAHQTIIRTLTRGIAVRDAMMTRFRTLAPDDTLNVAVDELLSGSDQDFPVVQDGQVIGILTRKDLLKALAERGRSALVGSVTQPNCMTIEDSAMLEDAFAQMESSNCQTIPVVRGNRVVGVLTLENVGELMMVSSALHKAGAIGVRQAVTPH